MQVFSVIFKVPKITHRIAARIMHLLLTYVSQVVSNCINRIDIHELRFFTRNQRNEN